jgi:hypothetical protein
MGTTGPTPPWRSMFWRMLEKNAGAPGTWVVVFRVKRGDSLHSRASLVAASTVAGFDVFIVEVKNLGLVGEEAALFDKGVLSINDGVSAIPANPPSINRYAGKEYLLARMWFLQIQLL